ncbi:MAG: inner membrane CreD family protein, partial [Campylobacter sp.]|nr:inner membrane CreD family protein [Campylobacter sp.]
MASKNLNLNKNSLWVKPVIIFILLLLMLIPLGFIKSILYDRQAVKSEAEQSIMTPVGGALEVQGILLSLPFKRTIEVQSENGTQTKKVTKQILVTPKDYQISTQIDPKYLKRGIFSVPIFNGEVNLNAEFEALDYEHLGVKEDEILFDEALIILGIGNKKTFTSFPKLTVNFDTNDTQQISQNNAQLAQSFMTHEFSPFSQSIYYKLPQ